MLHDSKHPLHRGSRRFRNGVENRFFVYQRPESIWSKCGRCQRKVVFFTDNVPSYVRDEESHGYRVVEGFVGGEINGRGACTFCGCVQTSLHWPEAAFLQVSVAEGVVWAWNADYLEILRARVSGSKTELRHMLMHNWDYARFISRLPTYVVLVKNRSRILKGFNKLIAAMK